MKNFFFLLLLVFGGQANVASLPKNNDICGLWMSMENNLEVEVFKTGSEFRAKIVWFDGSDDKSIPVDKRCDLKNPDENLRTRKIIGLEVMHGLVYNAKNNDWENGRIYDSSSGKTWDAKVSLTKDGNLKVRGYWHFQFLGQNVFFKKICLR